MPNRAQTDGSCADSLGCGLGRWRQDVVPGESQSLDVGEFDQSAFRTTTRKHGDDVDRLRDECTGNGDDGLLYELLEPSQCTQRRAGMDRADSPGVSGAPGLQEIERFGAADFTDRNAVRAQPQG